MTTDKQALILGGTGGSGGEIGLALKRHGWRIRAMGRNPQAAARQTPAFEWVKGDAMNRDDVIAAADGASVIVHAVNPPGYRNWAGTVVPMIENTIAAAHAAGARVVLPGTVYNYGPDALPLIAEDAPQSPRTRKGKIRVALEERLAQAGVRALILRAGDFFGPRTSRNSWFVQMVKPGKPASSILYPGQSEVGHAWCYLPDFGETVARLLEREDDLAPFARFHFGGHYFERGIDFAECIRDVVDARLPIVSLPWFAVRLAAPFNESLRETLEMRYLWRQDLKLDNSSLVRFLGAEPHTPIHDALRRTLEGQGSLPRSAGVRPLAAA
ncbi:MAG: NAD(P)H-binding protein [Alphaproteobacteria bacterium]|nr:NAD(P)H-binding protein [Alphaproteobacteria bacterium]